MGGVSGRRRRNSSRHRQVWYPIAGAIRHGTHRDGCTGTITTGAERIGAKERVSDLTGVAVAALQ
jgi:hypothetical protein